MSTIAAVTYEGSYAVTVSDTDKDPKGPFAGLLVTAAGTIKLTMMDGSTITLASSVAANTILPLATQRVWSTGTSATVIGLVAAPFKPARSS